MSNQHRSCSEVTVMRLGGSLLCDADLNVRLWNLVTACDPCLIVCGGGVAADEIRRLDRLTMLKTSQAHWFAIEAMSFNADVLVRTCGPGLVLVASRRNALDAWASGRVPVLDSAEFLRAEEKAIATEEVQSSEPLPASWDVTSDSIAAWVAHRWPAKRLILAKSCEQPAGSIEDWSETGAVDGYFPRVSNGLQIEWINLKKTEA